jgi:hypothetical protein
MTSILKAIGHATASLKPQLDICWALLLAALLLGVVGTRAPTRAQTTQVIPVGGQKEPGQYELFLGGGTGGANWQILGQDTLLPVDFNGFRASGYYQKPALYAHFSLEWDTLTVHGPGERQPSFSRTDLSGRILGSMVRGPAGGLAAGLYGRYNRSHLYARPQDPTTPRAKLREAETVGALLALHSNLESPTRLVVMGGGLIERRSTGVDLPVPQLLAGVMAGIRAELPLGPQLRVHLRADGGARGWSSAQVEAGLTGELVKGFFWDGSARLSVKLFGGISAYGGVSASGRSEVVRFREGPREVDVSENFTTRLSGTFGIVFRDL